MDPPYSYSLNPPVFGTVPNANPLTPNATMTGTPTPAGRGRGRGAGGIKRARKPRGGGGLGASSQRLPQNSPGAASPVFANYQYSHVHWATPGAGGAGQGGNMASSSTAASGAGTSSTASGSNGGTESVSLSQGNITSSPKTSPATFGAQDQTAASSSQQTTFPIQSSSSPVPGPSSSYSMPSGTSIPMLDTTGLISLTGSIPPILPTGSAAAPVPVKNAGDEDVEGDDELLPAMADDDYSAQLSWQSQSKDNLKCVQMVQMFTACLTRLSTLES